MSTSVRSIVGKLAWDVVNLSSEFKLSSSDSESEELLDSVLFSDSESEELLDSVLLLLVLSLFRAGGLDFAPKIVSSEFTLSLDDDLGLEATAVSGAFPRAISHISLMLNWTTPSSTLSMLTNSIF